MARINVKHGKGKPKSRPNKINLVFDEAKRRDFLTGFHKRKIQRKKHAQEKLEQELKDERKRLKAEAKESYKKLVVSHRDIPELQNLLSQEHEEDDVNVRVVELSASFIAKQNNWIGPNQPKYESNEPSEDEDDNQASTKIPGMDLNYKPKKEQKNSPKKEFHSEKQVKRELKKQATKNVQKSKVFLKKNKIERQKQKKQSFRARKQKDGIKHKFSKKKGNKSYKDKD